MKQATTHSSTPLPRSRENWFWSRAHFLLRLVGLAGFLAVCVGLVLARGIDQFYDSWDVAHQTVRDTLHGHGPTEAKAKFGMVALLGGGAALLVVLFVEALLIARFVAARRSLMGFSAVVQIALAAALLIGANIVAFRHSISWDLTRGKEFTLPDAVKADLQNLKGETLIVVQVRPDSITGAQRDAKVETIEKAAKQEVVERVKDLVDQFRQAGPQFRVVVLDDHDKGYEEEFEKVTKNADKLRDAIKATPESSIFFYANGRVQQLSFKDFYLVDMAASQEGRGNLVLLTQGEGPSGRGVEAFARKIFNIDERRPRIGVLVVHDLLTSLGSIDVFTHKALRKTLEDHGFDVRDVVLWNNLGSASAEPVAYTPDEQRFKNLQNRLASITEQVRFFELAQRELPALLNELKAPPGPDEERRLLLLSRKYFQILQGDVILPENKAELIEYYERRLETFPEMLADKQQERDKVQGEMDELRGKGVDLGLHMSDLNGKMKRVLAECDLLYIPRLTRTSPDSPIPSRVHRLSDEHIAAIKEFLKSGKPLLASIGPVNDESPNGARPNPADLDDNLEKLLAELGVRVGPQTVLFGSDSQAIADYKMLGFLSPQTGEEVPPVALQSTGVWTGYRPILSTPSVDTPNPLSKSLQVTARSEGPTFRFNIRFARPVYYDPTQPPTPQAATVATHLGLLTTPAGTGPLLASALPPWKVRRYSDQPQNRAQLVAAAASIAPAMASGDLTAFGALRLLPQTQAEPTFLYTATGWNESNPFAEDEFGPTFQPPKPNDPANGTLDERRRGSFPIGIALEEPVPPSWDGKPGQMVRIAVIGQGNVFGGPELSGPKKQLLLQTTNWLLGREDLLPRDDHVLRYPRVEYGSSLKDLLEIAAVLGLPGLFALLGIMVLLARNIR